MNEERLKIAGCTVLKVIILSDINWSKVIYNFLTKTLNMTYEDIAATMESIKITKEYAEDVRYNFYRSEPLNLPGEDYGTVN